MARGRKKGVTFPSGYHKKVKNAAELVEAVKTIPEGSIVVLDETKQEESIAA